MYSLFGNRRTIRILLTGLLLAVLISACNPTVQSIPPTQSAIPSLPAGNTEASQSTSIAVPAATIIPSQNPIASTDAIDISVTPSLTSQPTKKPTRTPQPTRTPRPTRTPTDVPPTATPARHDGPIRIFQPSSFSRVSSPLKLVMSVLPGGRGRVFMLLTGEDGRIILEKTWEFPFADGRRTSISEEIAFTLPGLSEAARLTVFTRDEFGRLASLNTEDILLITVGKEDLAEPDNLDDPFTMVRPFPMQNIRNSQVIFNGAIRCRKDCRLKFEVVDSKGNQIAELFPNDIYQAGLNFLPIEYAMPYKVNSPTWVRLVMHQVDLFTGDDMAVSSMIVRIYP